MKFKFILLLLLLFNSLFAQVIETDDNKKDSNFFKVYSSNIKFSTKFKNTKQFIKDLDLNLLTYIKEDELNNKFFDFYYNGNYRGTKYLNYYLEKKINSKALSLTQKDKLKICGIIKKYNTNSPDGDYCSGNVIYKNSKFLFWNYLPYFFKGYIEYIQEGKNLNIFFYSTIYFLIFFLSLILLISFTRSFPLLIKDVYSLIFIKRPQYESFFWAISLIMLGLYLASFNILLLLMSISAISFAYMDKKFIPLFIFLILTPFFLNFSFEIYKNYDFKIDKNNELAFEVIHEDILPTYKQINKLKKTNSFFSNVALADIYKKEGDFRLGLKYYNNALEIKKMGFLYNNIANIYALKNDYKMAINYYNDAKYNDNVIYFYNMSKVYYRLKNSEKASYYRKLANNLNTESVKKFDKISTFNSNRFFIDKFPQYKEFLKIYSNINKLKLNNYYSKLFSLNNKRYLIDVSISIAIFLFLFLMFRSKLKSAYCQRCGVLFNNLDITERHNSFELCASCYSMMNTRSSLKKEELIKKEKDIRMKKIIKKYRDLLINLIFPGSIYFYKFNSYLGLLFLLWHSYFIIVVVAYYSKWKLIININFFNFFMIVYIIIEVLLYLYTYFKLIKRR